MTMNYEDGLFGLFLEEVRAHLPYICHLKISSDVFFRSLGYELQHALVSPAPFLEYFSLFCREDEIRSRAVNHLPDIETLRLFGGSTPRLSCLKLHNCNITWNSLLFKGLKHLEILLPHKRARPTLSIWLDALKEIPQLNTLILHSASPIAVHFPIDVERTVTIPSLTLLDISASLQDCALAIAHLVLPALSSLRLAEIHHSLPNRSAVQEFLHYVVQHVHGPQDIQPLQSVLIRNDGSRLQLLAWPVPDIDTFVHGPPSSLGATLPTRVMLSFSSISNNCREIFEIMMAIFPLDNLLTLTAVDLDLVGNLTQLWIRLFPNWPLLRRMRIGATTSREFIKALLKDDWGCENPLLPSLKELVLHDAMLDDRDQVFGLCDALMKRVEQGVPLETLDLRMCRTDTDNSVAVRLLSEIVVDILPPPDFLPNSWV